MYHLPKVEMFRICALFDGWEETILWSCLQGHMGNAWVDDLNAPKSAQIVVGSFCFFAGQPNEKLATNIPSGYSSSSMLMIPRHEGWCPVIEQAYPDHSRFMRYAIKKEPHVFDTEKLRRFASQLPAEYAVVQIDRTLLPTLQQQEWSRDFCSQFSSGADYEARGLGFAVLHAGRPVSGASSYTIYDNGIEIEVDTAPAYRRRGLALVCAANLILECLRRGLYPSWDAANKESVALAEKLGYHFDKEYITYAVNIKRFTGTPVT